MRLLRSTFFWLHLAAGLLCGAIILIMSFTGAVLAFEHEIVEWAERDVRRVEAPANTTAPGNAGLQPGSVSAALPLDDLIAKAREAATAPDAESAPRVTGVTITSDPRDAIVVAFGRDIPAHYVNPYTGEIKVAGATRTHDFMHLMEDWHRRLAVSEENRAAGRAITGASNAAFLFLALSGLWLWWPRQWAARFLRPALWFSGAQGKARDWNWHNVYGFWFMPVLVVLTASGMVISYRWASDLPYRLVGETPPAAPVPGAPAAPAQEFKIERPEGAKKLDYAAALARIQETMTGWTVITLREGLPQRRGAAPAATPGSAGLQPGSVSATSGIAGQGNGPAAGTGENARANAAPGTSESSSGARTGPRDGSGRGAGRAPQPYSATVKADDGSPAFASTQLVLHPFTGEVLSRTGYADQSTGRKIRTWLRYLHTGQALGWPGQLIAGIACLAGCILVYTGFALSWRRFFQKKTPAA